MCEEMRKYLTINEDFEFPYIIGKLDFIVYQCSPLPAASRAAKKPPPPPYFRSVTEVFLLPVYRK
jgi:hypothetical protein